MLLQNETGVMYADPVDIVPCPYTYTETDIDVEEEVIEEEAFDDPAEDEVIEEETFDDPVEDVVEGEPLPETGEENSEEDI